MSLRSKEREKWERRRRREMRVRSGTRGTTDRPRLSVYRSHRHLHCQIIDDSEGRTLAAASTQQKELAGGLKHGGNVEAAKVVGRRIAELAKQKGIAKVVFDRGFCRFHGRIRAFAQAAAEGGLDFLTNPAKKKAEEVKKPEKPEKPAKQEKKEKKEKPAKQAKKEA